MLFYVCSVIKFMLWCDVLLKVILVVNFEVGELLMFIIIGVCGGCVGCGFLGIMVIGL